MASLVDRSKRENEDFMKKCSIIDKMAQTGAGVVGDAAGVKS